jgi:hypothetical protein
VEPPHPGERCHTWHEERLLKFKEIVNRLTGFSTPVFGISWNPPQTHIAVARRVITFLEDRRVLYNPYHMEDPRHCIESVIEIRQFLTAELSNLSGDEELVQNLRAMRAACRKFLDTVQESDGRRGFAGHFRSGSDSWIFNSALGELRGVIGIHIAALAAQHGLDIEGDLATILPATDD